jgi:DNA-binding Xre family transcriptional regulator
MPKITITKQVTQEEEISVTQNKYIGFRITQLRKAKKMKQRELAEKVGYINISFLCQIENGHKACTLERLKMICEALDCKSSDILPF